MNSIFRVEARNHKNKFDLLGIRYSMDSAMKLAAKNDQFFVRIADCRNERRSVYRNYSWQDLFDI